MLFAPFLLQNHRCNLLIFSALHKIAEFRCKISVFDIFLFKNLRIFRKSSTFASSNKKKTLPRFTTQKYLLFAPRSLTKQKKMQAHTIRAAKVQQFFHMCKHFRTFFRFSCIFFDFHAFGVGSHHGGGCNPPCH